MERRFLVDEELLQGKPASFVGMHYVARNMIHPESCKRWNAAPGEERPESKMEGGKAIQS
jgi:hypothetical protein